MNKEELIRKVAKKSRSTIEDSRVIINTLFETIEDELVEGSSVSIYGFGTFDVCHRKERETTSVRGGRITIPAFDAPRFNAGASLRRSIRDGIVRR